MLSNIQQQVCSCHRNVGGSTWCGHAIPHLSRRRLFGNTLAVAAAGMLGRPLIDLAVPKAFAQSTLNPEAALKALMDGNKRFVDRNLRFYEEDLAILKENTAEKQEPFASV